MRIKSSKQMCVKHRQLLLCVMCISVWMSWVSVKCCRYFCLFVLTPVFCFHWSIFWRILDMWLRTQLTHSKAHTFFSPVCVNVNPALYVMIIIKTWDSWALTICSKLFKQKSFDRDTPLTEMFIQATEWKVWVENKAESLYNPFQNTSYHFSLMTWRDSKHNKHKWQKIPTKTTSNLDI